MASLRWPIFPIVTRLSITSSRYTTASVPRCTRRGIQIQIQKKKKKKKEKEIYSPGSSDLSAGSNSLWFAFPTSLAVPEIPRDTFALPFNA